MRSEIGSEFWDVPVAEEQNGLFPESTAWFLSGRSALQEIIRSIGRMETVALPSWCCDSMIKPFADAGIEVRFYPVRPNGDGVLQEYRTDCDALLLMDYFGFSGRQPELDGYKGVLIRDVTHSLFSRNCEDADYCFGSLRKWCGVWTGGFAWKRDGTSLSAGAADDSGYAVLRRQAMERKAAFIRGEEAADKSYLGQFGEAEALLERCGVSPAESRDVRLSSKLDVQSIRRRRRENAGILIEALPEMLLFPTLGETDCPLFVPILVPEGRRDALRRYLIEREIYCPIHWPVSGYHKLEEKDRFLYDNELSLICDQRYAGEDMARVIGEIGAFWKVM